MNDGAATAVIVISLILAGWCAVTVLRNRLIGVSLLVGAAILEVAVLVLGIVVVVNLVGGERPDGELGTFVGYLVGSAIAPPIGVVLGLGERSRWGPAVLGAICLVLPVLIVRLQQIGEGTGV
jgi:O-antigen ligase